MRQLIILLSTVIIATSCFAIKKYPPTTAKPDLKTLRSAWKTKASFSAKHNQNDIMMVYGGVDISRQSILNSSSIIT